MRAKTVVSITGGAANIRTSSLWQKFDLAEVAQHAGMNKVDPRSGGNRIGGGGLAGLQQAARKACLRAVKRAGETIGEAGVEAIACEDQAPGSHRGDRRILSLVAACLERQRLQEPVLGPDARDFRRARRDEPGAGGALGNCRKSGPPGAAAPERGDAPFKHHRGAVAGAVEIDRLKIPFGIEADSVKYRAR